MKNFSGPEVLAAVVGALAAFVLGVLLDWLKGQIPLLTVLVILAIIVLVALLLFLYKRGGTQVTGIALLVGIIIGLVVFFLAQGRIIDQPIPTPTIRVESTSLPSTIEPTFTSVPTSLPTPTQIPPTPAPTVAPLPTPVPSISVEQLNDKNIVLTGPTATENYRQQVQDWFNGPDYQALARLILATLGEKRFVRPVHLDTINGKYKLQFGVVDGLSTELYNDQDKLKAAVLKHWNDQSGYPRAEAFEQIVQ